MKKKELETFAREAAKSVRTGKGFNAFSPMRTRVTLETRLDAEIISPQLGWI